MPIYGKNFKTLLLQNQISPRALSLHKSSGTGDLPKLLKWWSFFDVWFDLFMARANLLSHAFVWALYIYMGKMLRIQILDISSIIQLNWNLMSIRAFMRHKIAKWADRESKMATTAAILKIHFRHLFSKKGKRKVQGVPNLRSLWAKTCSLATGWLLDRNKLNLCQLKIQDGRSGSALLNKMTARTKKKIENLQMTSRPWPMAWFQNICTEMFHKWPSTKITKMAPLGWTKWWPELKIEKPLKDSSSAASVLISK